MFYNERVKRWFFSEDILFAGAWVCCLSASADGVNIQIHDPWVLAAPQQDTGCLSGIKNNGDKPHYKDFQFRFRTG